MIDRKMFSAIFDSLASTPGGQPFIAEEGQLESVMNLVKIMRGGSDGKGKPEYSMWYAFNGDRQERPGDYRTSESRYGAETDDSRGTDYPPGNQ